MNVTEQKVTVEYIGGIIKKGTIRVPNGASHKVRIAQLIGSGQPFELRIIDDSTDEPTNKTAIVNPGNVCDITFIEG